LAALHHLLGLVKGLLVEHRRRFVEVIANINNAGSFAVFSQIALFDSELVITASKTKFLRVSITV